MIGLESNKENNREKTLNFINNNMNNILTTSGGYIAYKYWKDKTLGWLGKRLKP